MKRQIIAMGGAVLPAALDNLLLVEYFLRQTGKREPRVCLIGTATGDSDIVRMRYYDGFRRFRCRPTHLPLFARTPADLDDFLLSQDAIFVGGGNTKSMLAVWRGWGIDHILRAAWERGIVLGGGSAGSICWFEQGVTDSIAGPLTALDCLGFLAGSNCPHYDSEPARRPSYRRLVASGRISGGIAADDGVALHYVGEELARIVTSRPRATAYRVRRSEGRPVETRLRAARLGMR